MRPAEKPREVHAAPIVFPQAEKKPPAVAEPAPPAPRPLLEVIAESPGGCSFADLREATGLDDAALQAALDAGADQGKIASGVNNGTLCYYRK